MKMAVDDLARAHFFDPIAFDRFAKDNAGKYGYQSPMIGDPKVEMSDLSVLVEDYKKFLAEEKARYSEEHADEIAQAEQEQKELDEMRKACSRMLVTSGFSFEGYSIKKYSGYISGDAVKEVSRGVDGWFVSATNLGAVLSHALVEIRREAIAKLKEQAYELGCNAVIGVDYDYVTFEPETANSGGGTTYLPYVVCVSVNGNAVVLEKNQQ